MVWAGEHLHTLAKRRPRHHLHITPIAWCPFLGAIRSRAARPPALLPLNVTGRRLAQVGHNMLLDLAHLEAAFGQGSLPPDSDAFAAQARNPARPGHPAH